MAYQCALSAIQNSDIESFLKIAKTRNWREWVYENKDYQLLKKAIQYHSSSIVQLLLRMGCRVYKSGCTNTPLHVAIVTKGPVNLVKELLNRGARIALKNSRGETALHLAFASRASEEMIDLLLDRNLKRKAVNVKNKQGLSYLHIACTRNNISIVQKLIDSASANIHSQVTYDSSSSYAGCTPLHFAVKHEQFEIAEFLLTRGANLYLGDVNGSTPLHYALEQSNIAMIDMLLSFDSKRIDVINRFGLTHFMAACAGSYTDTVQHFIRIAGPSVPKLMNSQIKIDGDFTYPHSGYTPLHFAAEFGRTVTVHLLLGWGANCCAFAQSNLTPHNLASSKGHGDTLNVMKTHCLNKLQLSFQRTENANDNNGFSRDCRMPLNATTESNAEKYNILFNWVESSLDSEEDFKSSRCSTPIDTSEHLPEIIQSCLSSNSRSLPDWSNSTLDSFIQESQFSTEVNYLSRYSNYVNQNSLSTFDIIEEGIVPLDAFSEQFIKNL